MITEKMTVKEKKLKSFRKILWICFAGFSASILLGATPLSVVLTRGEIMETINGRDIPLWPFLIMSQVLAIVLIGGVCLVIYHIFKYRIDRKDDSLFL